MRFSVQVSLTNNPHVNQRGFSVCSWIYENKSKSILLNISNVILGTSITQRFKPVVVLVLVHILLCNANKLTKTNLLYICSNHIIQWAHEHSTKKREFSWIGKMPKIKFNFLLTISWIFDIWLFLCLWFCHDVYARAINRTWFFSFKSIKLIRTETISTSTFPNMCPRPAPKYLFRISIRKKIFLVAKARTCLKYCVMRWKTERRECLKRLMCAYFVIDKWFWTFLNFLNEFRKENHDLNSWNEFRFSSFQEGHSLSLTHTYIVRMVENKSISKNINIFPETFKLVDNFCCDGFGFYFSSFKSCFTNKFFAVSFGNRIENDYREKKKVLTRMSKIQNSTLKSTEDSAYLVVEIGNNWFFWVHEAYQFNSIMIRGSADKKEDEEENERWFKFSWTSLSVDYLHLDKESKWIT